MTTRSIAAVRDEFRLPALAAVMAVGLAPRLVLEPGQDLLGEPRPKRSTAGGGIIRTE
ncbi:hypothetical protein ACFFX1_41775 [Dactylosporangium sucinum]|uniref:hypothetical protein n=1 Tax=Dactylosporangium sucinum TaxID=1424081 RepID=UPI00167CAE94|nr:hypothetical protein [Dactylosporangium sucinum]